MGKTELTREKQTLMVLSGECCVCKEHAGLGQGAHPASSRSSAVARAWGPREQRQGGETCLDILSAGRAGKGGVDSRHCPEESRLNAGVGSRVRGLGMTGWGSGWPLVVAWRIPAAMEGVDTGRWCPAGLWAAVHTWRCKCPRVARSRRTVARGTARR